MPPSETEELLAGHTKRDTCHRTGESYMKYRVQDTSFCSIYDSIIAVCVCYFQRVFPALCLVVPCATRRTLFYHLVQQYGSTVVAIITVGIRYCVLTSAMVFFMWLHRGVDA